MQVGSASPVSGVIREGGSGEQIINLVLGNSKSTCVGLPSPCVQLC